MGKALACAELLLDFFKAVIANDWAQAETLQQSIVELENDADQMKQDIRLNLPKKLFLPVPREDVLEILTLQDKVPNKAKDIAGLVLGRRMSIPEAITETYLTLLQRCIDCSKKTQKAINEIDELLETSFAANEVTLIEELIFDIGKIEHETDRLQVEVRQQLFQIEKSLSAIDVIFLYKIVEWTGDIADRAEQISQRLHLLIAN